MLEQIVATREQPPLPNSFDSRVIAACQQGDRNALRQLFEAYKDRVYSLAVYSLAGDESTAADVTQKVFLKLMTCISQFRGDSEFATWLYRLVVNCCRDEQRKQRRFVPLSDLDSFRSRARGNPSARYAREELAGQVQAAVLQLKPKLRWPIVLRYANELSYEEMAAVLGCSKGTVASRLNRAHKALAKRLAHLRRQFD